MSVTGGSLFIDDTATTLDRLKVTESTVSGSTLFGGSGAVVHYQGLTALDLSPSQQADVTVAPSQTGARFSTPIEIDDFFTSGTLNVAVDVDSGSNLNLTLNDHSAKADNLTIAASTTGTVQARFNPQPPATPNGKETVSFFVPTPLGLDVPVGLASTVSYSGFDDVVLS